METNGLKSNVVVGNFGQNKNGNNFIGNIALDTNNQTTDILNSMNKESNYSFIVLGGDKNFEVTVPLSIIEIESSNLPTLGEIACLKFLELNPYFDKNIKYKFQEIGVEGEEGLIENDYNIENIQ